MKNASKDLEIINEDGNSCMYSPVNGDKLPQMGRFQAVHGFTVVIEVVLGDVAGVVVEVQAAAEATPLVQSQRQAPFDIPQQSAPSRFSRVLYVSLVEENKDLWKMEHDKFKKSEEK